jgi:hypothetical protein
MSRIRRLGTTYPLVSTGIAAAAVVAVGVGAGIAYWTLGESKVRVDARSASMPAGNRPSVSGSANSVIVSWPASTIVADRPVSGYSVVRYDADGRAHDSGGTCGGVVAATRCTEAGLAEGTYTYAIRPRQGEHWIGPEGLRSEPVTVSSTAIEFPVAEQTYGIASWAAGCKQFDICGSSSLTGKGSVEFSVRAQGGAYWDPGARNFSSQSERLIPAQGTKTWKAEFPITNYAASGRYVIRVVATDATGRQSPATVTYDVVPIAPAAPTFDSGPAQLTNTTDATLAVAGVPDGMTLWCATGKKAAFEACGNPITVTAVEGENKVRARLRDAAGNESVEAVRTWTVDATAPRAHDVQGSNGGGQAGVLDEGDTLVLTFSEPVDPASVVNGWSGDRGVAVRLTVDAGDEQARIAVLDESGNRITSVGSVTSKQVGLVPENLTAPATMALLDGRRLVLTVGPVPKPAPPTDTPTDPAASPSPSASVSANAPRPGDLVWNPGQVKDLATNALVTDGAQAVEKGAKDIDF